MQFFFLLVFIGSKSLFIVILLFLTKQRLLYLTKPLPYQRSQLSSELVFSMLAPWRRPVDGSVWLTALQTSTRMECSARVIMILQPPVGGSTPGQSPATNCSSMLFSSFFPLQQCSSDSATWLQRPSNVELDEGSSGSIPRRRIHPVKDCCRRIRETRHRLHVLGQERMKKQSPLLL